MLSTKATCHTFLLAITASIGVMAVTPANALLYYANGNQVPVWNTCSEIKGNSTSPTVSSGWNQNCAVITYKNQTTDTGQACGGVTTYIETPMINGQQHYTYHCSNPVTNQ